MRKKCFNCNFRIPINLQVFAEGGESDPGSGAAGGGTEERGEEQKPPSFDELLKDESNRAEFDRRIKEATSTAVKEAQEKWKLLTDDKVSEAEKLAKMNQEEKDRYMQKKKERELADREAKITKRELMAEAKNTLAEKKLPVSLAEVLNYADAETCNKSIAAVEKAFQEAVQAAVQERLKGGRPPKKAPEDQAVTKEQYSKMGYAERLKLKTEHPELYKQLSGN